jgi:hypothetical protein
MTFTLDENEITFILNVLGELPSKTGAFVLLQKLDEQLKAQKQEAPTA